jgi:23S rRNA pseudouridine1911/1915/1917 synthase
VWKIPVSESAAGSRLDVFLAKAVAGASRAAVQRWIVAGRVQVDGLVRKSAYRVSEGETVEVDPLPPEPMAVEPHELPLDIVYQDDDFVVLNKPAGVVVHPGAGIRRGTLVNALVYRYGSHLPAQEPLRPGIVHRLDKGTSGVMVVALKEFSHRELVKQFQTRQVAKRYLALVYGRVDPPEGVIDLPLGRDRRHRTRISPRTDRPRNAVTAYRVLRFYDGFSFLEVRPVTGRTHQIRVHFWARGFPVVGDNVYVRRDRVRPLPGGFQLDRLFLHAESLEFHHPRTGRRLVFTVPLPDELVEILNRLGK